MNENFLTPETHIIMIPFAREPQAPHQGGKKPGSPHPNKNSILNKRYVLEIAKKNLFLKPGGGERVRRNPFAPKGLTNKEIFPLKNYKWRKVRVIYVSILQKPQKQTREPPKTFSPLKKLTKLREKTCYFFFVKRYFVPKNLLT